jgi:beta-lactamase class A
MAVAALAAAVALGTLVAHTDRQEPRVPDAVRQAMNGFRGEMGVAATNLDTGETIAIDADTRFPTASLIKVAVMVEVFHQIAGGTLRRDTAVTLSDADKVGDETVVLNQMQAGLRLTVSDLVALTIAYSDNTATNLLIRLVGTANVTRRMAAYGLPQTKLFRPTFRDGHADVFPEEEREFGLGMTTPREAARLFELIARGKVVSPEASEEMVRVLERQTDQTMIGRSLPYERGRIVVASKSGTDAEKHPDARGVRGHVRTDAAIVQGPDARFVIAICTRRVEDTRWTVDNDALVTGGAVARAVYDHFSRARK